MPCKPKNLFDRIPDDLSDEWIESIVQNKEMAIERIVTRVHVHDDWYDQDKDEFVLLLKGQAKIRFEKDNEMIDLKDGDYIIISAHERHKVEWTSEDQDTIWLAVHY